MAPHSSTLAWKIHGWRSLVGCSPWGRWELDKTERLHFHFSISCIGEGNGNPLQYSCLENPRDGGAWWASIYGVAQSRIRLKRLSSSSSCLLDLIDYFLFHIGKIFNYNLFKNFLMPFLFLFVWDPYNSKVGAFDIVPVISERVSSVIFLLFTLF